MTKIYVASSWRCSMQPAIIHLLRAAKFDVYDFRNPAEGNSGFHWTEINPTWKGELLRNKMTPEEYLKEALPSDLAVKGFSLDYNAMDWADLCVLVLPCGRSAHLEAGWFVGQGKPLHILLSEEGFEPELMYKMATSITTNTMDLLGALAGDRNIEKERAALGDRDLKTTIDALFL